MADEPRNFDPDTTDANRTRMQGGGVGQRELSGQHDPDRNVDVTAPKPPASAGDREDGTAGRDRGRYPERNAADRHDTRGALGAGTPANVDIHDTGEDDNPQADWGEAREGAVHSSNHTKWGEKTEAERGQGAKTRARNKEINSGGL